MVEKVGQLPKNAALCLTAQTEQDQVMARQHGIDDVGDDRVVIAHDTGKDGLAVYELFHQVPPHLVLHTSRPITLFTVGAGAEFSQSFRLRSVLTPPAEFTLRLSEQVRRAEEQEVGAEVYRDRTLDAALQIDHSQKQSPEQRRGKSVDVVRQREQHR